MAGELLYTLAEVVYRYPDGQEALSNVSLKIFGGEKLVLLGANGSGKSTLLKILDGLIFPQEGKVSAFGQDLSAEKFKNPDFNFAFRKRVGFVFQNSDAQLSNPTVREEIAFGPLQMGLDKTEVRRRVGDIARLLGLEKILDRPTFKLSGGEKKKVAIAALLAVNPEVYLLDEPTGGLDPRTRRWVVNLFKQLNSAGKTIVTATHDLDIIGELAGRVLVLDENHRLAAEGTPSEILGDRELLLRVNLIDAGFHRHRHEDGHSHYHFHAFT